LPLVVVGVLAVLEQFGLVDELEQEERLGSSVLDL